MPAFIDITGQRFYKLVAVEYAGNRKWKFNCDCGKQTTSRIGDVKLGRTQSCGCLRIDGFLKRTLHGHCKIGQGGKGSPTWNTWQSMHQRCSNPNNEAFKWYGARGISVCDEWSDFRNFLADMGEKPPGLSIGRIDNDGNYCKDNYRWETPTQQSNNQRTNRLVTISGQTKTFAQWAAEIGINYQTARARVGYGWSDVDALTIPAGRVGIKRNWPSPP